MALQKVTYIDNQTVITAKNMNDMQDAIIEAENKAEEAKTAAENAKVTTDATLTKEGHPADAKATGDAVAAAKATASENLTTHNTNTEAHADLRLELQELADRINAALDSDDETLDELSEIVAYIKSNKSLIEAITTSKVSVSDIVDNLVTNVANKPLSAAQGVVLKALIDAVTTAANNAASAASTAQTTAAEAKAIATGATVPDYWEEAVAEVIEQIKTLHNEGGRNCTTFAFFSDTHYRLGSQGVLIAEVLKRTNSRFSFFGGDAVSNDYIEDEATMILHAEKFDEVMSPIPSEKDCRTVGNHDGMWKTSAGAKHNYPWEKAYNLFYRRQAVSQNKHFGGDGSFYYVDDKAAKVRFVVLNSMWFAFRTGDDASSTKTTNGFGAEQFDWLINKALVFEEEGWSVVFISHAPLTNKRHSYLRDVRIMQGILTAYVNKNSYSGSYTDSANAGNSVPTITVDYSNAITANIVGWFSGHIHTDSIENVDETTDSSNPVTLPFNVVTITGDMGHDYYTDSPVGSLESDTGHAIDFVTVNTETKKVTLTRLGGGDNRVYSYDNAVMYSITNNLSNVYNNNGASSINEGSSYSAILTAKTGYELESVTVTMGGVDVTSSAYSGGTVNISEVTGNIVITATAKEAAANYTNLFNPDAATLNTRLNSSGATTSLNGFFVTDYMPIPDSWKGDGTDKVYIKNPGNTISGGYTATGMQKVQYYNSSKTSLGAAVLAPIDDTNQTKVTIEGEVGWFAGATKNGSVVSTLASATYIRLALAVGSSDTAANDTIDVSDIADVIITINEPIA